MAYLILHNFINALSRSEYPDSIKFANITPIFKKDNKCGKTNYRAINFLSKLRKIYDPFMQNQIYLYLDRTFLKYQYRLRKEFNVQNCLMTMIEK